MSKERISLRMKRVTKAFPGTLAVDGVDFDVRQGEVHALLGENGAGKSTLMKMLAGSFADYTGEIQINGESVTLRTPSEAIDNGIGMIYQELSLARPITIAENVLVGRLPKKNFLMLDKQKMREETLKILESVGLELDPFTFVEDISPHEAQLVEIAKVMSHNPSILVMDEPTSSLSRQEVEKLFSIIDDLKAQGLAIVYISHHLPEIFRVADRFTVMRDGKKIATGDISDVTASDIVNMMVGKSMTEFYKKRANDVKSEKALIVEHISREGFFHDLSFHAYKGEILGIVGLAGAGRSEMARSMVGIDPMDSGRIEINGKVLKSGSYSRAIKSGMVYLSEDRKNDGLFLRLSVKENVLAAKVTDFCNCGVYSKRHEGKTVRSMIEKLYIQPPNPNVGVGNLSGGNQQKVLLGKWLACTPDIIILDEPSRGVDVGAKSIIHDVIIELADMGKTVILLTSDLPEMVGLADRVMVLKEGHMIGSMEKEQLTEESILLAANGEGI